MKKKIILLLILLIAGFFRFYQLSQVPPSLSLDEVSIGWNAYSILKTGADEYGTKLPILLRAYDDWRPAGYVYLVIPFIKVLGLSVVSVRLPSVILSILTVWLTYLLGRELFKKRGETVGLVASFLLAISPWHIYLSRLGHEVNLGLTFSLLAIFFFIKWVNFHNSALKKRALWLSLSSVFFALSFYTYQSQKIFGPLIVLSLVIIYRNKLLKFKKEMVLVGLLGLVLMLPIFKASLSSQALIRFQGTSIFTNQPEIYQRSSLRIDRDYKNNYFPGLIFDNRKVALGLLASRAYFSHFNPSWLFFNEGQESHKAPGMGLFHLWELPLLLVGIYQLFKGKYSSEVKFLLSSWVLIGLIPASLGTQAPHAMRVFNILPVPQIVMGLGALAIFSSFKNRLDKKGLRLLTGSGFLLLAFSLSYFFHSYFINFPYERSEDFQYSLAQVFDYLKKEEDQFKKIVIANHNHGQQSYMFYLFFNQYDPGLYQQQGGTISGGYAQEHQIGKYQFRSIDWASEPNKAGILWVMNSDSFSGDNLPLKTFSSLDGKKAMKLIFIKEVLKNEEL